MRVLGLDLIKKKCPKSELAVEDVFGRLNDCVWDCRLYKM